MLEGAGLQLGMERDRDQLALGGVVILVPGHAFLPGSCSPVVGLFSQIKTRFYAKYGVFTQVQRLHKGCEPRVGLMGWLELCHYAARA